MLLFFFFFWNSLSFHLWTQANTRPEGKLRPRLPTFGRRELKGANLSCPVFILILYLFPFDGFNESSPSVRPCKVNALNSRLLVSISERMQKQKKTLPTSSWNGGISEGRRAFVVLLRRDLWTARCCFQCQSGLSAASRAACSAPMPVVDFSVGCHILCLYAQE